MDTQSVIAAGRLMRLGELKDEIARLKEENSRLREEAASLRAHFDLALLAARDLAALRPGATFYLVDAWNLVLGSATRTSVPTLGTAPSPLGARLAKWLQLRRTAPGDWKTHSPSSLLAEIRLHLAENPADFAWAIFDGPRENSTTENRLRVTYTGGSGTQRADRMMLDFIRMARLAAFDARIVLISSDKDLLRAAKKSRNN